MAADQPPAQSSPEFSQLPQRLQLNPPNNLPNKVNVGREPKQTRAMPPARQATHPKQQKAKQKNVRRKNLAKLTN